MPKKKGSNKIKNADFTLNDCANAPKPVSRVKKSVSEAAAPELSWENIQDDEFDIVEEVDCDGTKNIVCRKTRNNSKTEPVNIKECPGPAYPEIVWYLISQYVKPEEIGTFSRINKVTYAITKRGSFWRTLYLRYCKNHPKLPERLRIENSYIVYGLRQRVIRALYHTYDVFIKKVSNIYGPDINPHSLVKRRCINVWYCKGRAHWLVYFKFKKLLSPQQRIQSSFIEELGKVDANPDEDTQVLQVTCQSFFEVPPLMGMTLSSLSVVLSQGFRYYRLHLGFNTGLNVSRDAIPECSVVLDTVVNMSVVDWWHPKYPHFDNILPSSVRDEEALPVLKEDFFKIRDSDI